MLLLRRTPVRSLYSKLFYCQLNVYTVHILLDDHPNHFLKVRKNQSLVRNTVETEFSITSADNLPIVHDDNDTSLVVHLTPIMQEMDAKIMTTPSEVLIKRYNRAFSPAQCDRLQELFLALMATKPRFSSGLEARSATQALHLGVWEFSSDHGPVITSESKHQKKKTIAAMDDLLQYLKDTVVARINRLWSEDFPDQVARGQRSKTFCPLAFLSDLEFTELECVFWNTPMLLTS